MLLGSKAQSTKCNIKHLTAGEDRVVCNNTLQYLGVYIDSQQNLKDQIAAKSKTCSVNLYYIKQIRHYFSKEVCQQLVQSLIISYVDYPGWTMQMQCIMVYRPKH